MLTKLPVNHVNRKGGNDEFVICDCYPPLVRTH